VLPNLLYAVLPMRLLLDEQGVLHGDWQGLVIRSNLRGRLRNNLPQYLYRINPT
jgi:hypothetical protein